MPLAMPLATPLLMPVVFVALLGGSLALWADGQPARTVFAAALPAWAAFAVMLAPMLRRYRAAMGIGPAGSGSASSGAAAGSGAARGWGALRLRLAGVRVVALGALTSALPFVAAAAQWLGGQDLSLFLAPPAAGRLGFALGATLFLLPFVTSWLHLAALSQAAEAMPIEAGQGVTGQGVTGQGGTGPEAGPASPERR